MRTSELKGAALDWAVAKCEGHDAHFYNGVVRTTMRGVFGSECSYSTDWSQGGPIIEREAIVVALSKEHGWTAARELWYLQDEADHALCSTGKTYLEAAMRCYVASQLGDEVEIPEELK